MNGIDLSEADRRQIKSMGISEDRLRADIETFRKSDFFVSLDRQCTLEDGIHKILPAEMDRYARLQQTVASDGRFMKFVPASGAASRMFQGLLRVYHDLREERRSNQPIVSVDSQDGDLLRFAEMIEHFAFFEDLKAALSKDSESLEHLIRQRRFSTLLEYLLTPRGLDYGSLPKSLIRFHRYPDRSRTAFEEHLVDSTYYLTDKKRKCRIHFTVSPEHYQGFLALFQSVRQSYEERYEVGYEVDFSLQDPSTNTLAVDPANQPFRDRDGRLHFRPGGHGALLGNLNNLKGDLVYIKNVDNLVPDRLKSTAILWKQILGGYLVELQDMVRTFIRDLKGESSRWDLDTVANFTKERLLIPLPQSYYGWSQEQKCGFLLDKLNRPIRVCGVVPNVGEPGGAPFWVRDKNGEYSIQIVEKAQVDFGSIEQRNVWMSSTHFNPVDLVCGVRDYEGKPFDLSRYVDTEAVFISQKSSEGRELRALELPGLWNGAMADWITVVVEVPKITFNPVKTVFDLLRPEHLDS